ncbi:DUF5596 domain-containing protein [Brachybacterium sp. EF45031]|uniref:acyltransferase domain-containing protein n=1 Tax=Brachybacterium sillae TaxID=2810536 RepID=UPI00217EBFE6|nr:acyltransferase domain-containing protein [Brachybacterium sillae]MCS6711354.1 DUF5596 domain-containing protein [Brachybacterium sillae]
MHPVEPHQEHRPDSAPAGATPPREVRADGPLGAAAVRVMLTAPSRTRLLELLGITGEDARELPALMDAAAADDAVLQRITERANALRARAGLETPPVDLPAVQEEDDTLTQRIAPGEGLIAILAHLVSTDPVQTWHRARGLSTADSWRTLADLGQQMRVHRASSGRLGLHQVRWTALNWAGRLVTRERLQFDLHRVEDRWVIGVHVPAEGPLEPAAVDAALTSMRTYAETHYADLGVGREFRCDSWLLNPLLIETLGADSNIGSFAARWRLLESRRDDDSVAFFVFGVRPPYDPGRLPRRTRLERLVAERLADGRGWESWIGELRLD